MNTRLNFKEKASFIQRATDNVHLHEKYSTRPRVCIRHVNLSTFGLCTRYWVALIIWGLLFITMDKLHGENVANYKKGNEAVNLKQTYKALDHLINDRTNSYQMFLWKAFHILRSAGLEQSTDDKGVKWKKVQKVLNQHNILLTEHWPKDKIGGWYKYVSSENLSLQHARHPQKFYVLFVVDEQTHAVLRAEPHLISVFELPFHDPIVQTAYDEASVVNRLWLVDEVKNYTLKYSTVESVDVSYGSIKSSWMHSGAMGFTVELDLKKEGGKGQIFHASISYTTSSHLDPESDGDGNSVCAEQWKAEDTLSYGLKTDKGGLLEDGHPGIFEARDAEYWPRQIDSE